MPSQLFFCRKIEYTFETRLTSKHTFDILIKDKKHMFEKGEAGKWNTISV